MAAEIIIRRARPEDAEHLSRLIQTTLRVSNAGDYPAAVIDHVIGQFSEPAVQAHISTRQVLVAVRAECILGTASLAGAVVRTVFVDPASQRLGIGRKLMDAIESMAKQAGMTSLRVPASLTAERFYSQIGYSYVRKVYDGAEKTIVMEKAMP